MSDNHYCHPEALDNSTPEPNIPHRRPARGLGERLDSPEAPLEVSSTPPASSPKSSPCARTGLTTELLPGKLCGFLSSSWSITTLNLSAEELLPFYPKQRSASQNESPLKPTSGTRTLFSLLFWAEKALPYHLSSQCTTYCSTANATDGTLKGYKEQ